MLVSVRLLRKVKSFIVITILERNVDLAMHANILPYFFVLISAKIPSVFRGNSFWYDLIYFLNISSTYYLDN